MIKNIYGVALYWVRIAVAQDCLRWPRKSLLNIAHQHPDQINEKNQTQLSPIKEFVKLQHVKLISFIFKKISWSHFEHCPSTSESKKWEESNTTFTYKKIREITACRTYFAHFQKNLVKSLWTLPIYIRIKKMKIMKHNFHL